MAIETGISTAAANAEADALGALLDGGYFRIYNGDMPADTDSAITDQVLLAELRFSNPAFLPAVGGEITAKVLTPETDARATGDASWSRSYSADGVTPVIQGTVGVKDSPNPGDRYNTELNSTSIQQHGVVSISSFTYQAKRV